MKKEAKQKLTLDRQAVYRIEVPGLLDERWMDWVGGMHVSAGSGPDDQPITILTGALDQAALHGLLRRLYNLGLPLISVNCMD